MAEISEDPYFFILKSPHYPPAELLPLLLGRIVQNFASPFDSFTPRDPRPFLKLTSEYIECTVKDVSAISSGTEDESLRLKLKPIAEFSSRRNSSGSTEYKTNRIRSVRITEHPKVFKSLLANTDIEREVRSWLTPGGSPAYLIVGAAIWEDAQLTQEASSDKDAGGSLTASIGTATAAAASMGAAVPAWTSGIGDFTVDDSLKAQTHKTISVTTEGSSIFAIECRLVYRRLIKIFTGSPVELSNRGPRYPPPRTMGDPEKKEEKNSPDNTPKVEFKDTLVPDFDEELAWTENLKDVTVVETDSFRFVYGEQ